MTRSRFFILVQRWWRRLLKQRLYWVDYDKYSKKDFRRVDKGTIAIWAKNEMYALIKAQKHLEEKGTVVMPCISKSLA